jgi:iron-sulfur cluster repair protein YtfE (RIC family)
MEVDHMSEGIIESLRNDHDQVQDLFAQLEDATGEEKTDLFRLLVAELVRHEVAEEEILRPLSRRDAGDRVVDARLKEESEAEAALAELEGMDTSTREFDERLASLRLAVERHASAEEADEFPKVEEAHGAALLQVLGKAYEAAKAAAPTRPHPATPNGALANLLVGPYVAVIDRARDAVREALKAVS